jgi:hypothetical protein
MAAGQAFQPAPTRLTNRGLIRQMESWGWKVKKVSGDDTFMVSPVGDKITVRSAHVHVGTDKHTINEMLALMGDDMTWEKFMRPITEVEEIIGQVYRSSNGDPVKAAKETLASMERVTEKERRRAEEAAAAERERQIAQKQEAKRLAKEARQREDTPVSNDQTQQAPRQRGNVDIIFDAILRTSGPISNATLAAQTGLTKEQAGTAANYLYNALHVIDRVKRGVWMRKHEYSAHDMSVDIVSRHIETVREVGAEERPKAPVVRIREMTPSEELDDTLNEVLDVILPRGFKARHLALIDIWRADTKALIQAVQEDL